eukprot:10454872-Alexandrium_andersonii.AAC.1
MPTSNHVCGNCCVAPFNKGNTAKHHAQHMITVEVLMGILSEARVALLQQRLYPPQPRQPPLYSRARRAARAHQLKD